MRLLLIDGHYYIYRSFFAIQSLSNSQGQPTNAIYGFIKTVRKMLKDVQPDLAAVLWDQGLPKRRVELQPAYKQQRAEMPDLMRPQVGYIIDELTPLMGLPSLGLPDTEADDIMACYTHAARAAGHSVVLATNDKDLFQLVDEQVTVYSTNKADLATPKDAYTLLGREAVRAKWGVEPAQIGEVLALIGDTVDNIPGVGGLGQKGAAALIGEYGDVQNLLANLDQIKKPALREKLAGARDLILQNREMVRLDCDIALPLPVVELRVRPRYAELLASLQPWEFKSLYTEIQAEAEATQRLGQGELF